MKKNLLITLCKSLFLTTILACAQAQANSDSFSSQSIKACKGKNKGDACALSLFNAGTIDGTCLVVSQTDSALHCLPPSKQAFNACVGKVVGDACSFTTKKNKVKKGFCSIGLDRTFCFTDLKNKK